MTAVSAIAACSRGPSHATGPATSTVNAANVGRAPACSTRSSFGVGAQRNEIHEVSRDTSLWGLALGPGRLPPRVGDQLKIVWRMTGFGALHVTFTGPDGVSRPLLFGPQRHGGATTYVRPGDEWGTGFRFTSVGCWHIHLARTGATGDVWLDVAA